MQEILSFVSEGDIDPEYIAVREALMDGLLRPLLDNADVESVTIAVVGGFQDRVARSLDQSARIDISTLDDDARQTLDAAMLELNDLETFFEELGMLIEESKPFQDAGQEMLAMRKQIVKDAFERTQNGDDLRRLVEIMQAMPDDPRELYDLIHGEHADQAVLLQDQIREFSATLPGAIEAMMKVSESLADIGLSDIAPLLEEDLKNMGELMFGAYGIDPGLLEL